MTIKWVDPAVSYAVLTAWEDMNRDPAVWPVTLYADDGTRPAAFQNAAELMAATVLSDSEAELRYRLAYLRHDLAQTTQRNFWDSKGGDNLECEKIAAFTKRLRVW